MDIFSVFDCDYQAAGAGTLINQSVFDRLLELNPGKELIEYNANKPIYKQVPDRTIQQDRDKSAGDIAEGLSETGASSPSTLTEKHLRMLMAT